MRKTFIALALVTVVAIVAGPATAGGNGRGGGKPAGGGGGTISLVLLNSTDGSAHWGQQVTFDVSTSATTKPSVTLTCWQGSAEAYRSSAGFYPEYPWQWAQTFTLQSAVWSGGDADCTATLYYVDRRGRTQTLSSIGFHTYA